MPTFVWAERAAALDTSAERLAWIEREVPEAFRELVRNTLPHFLVARIEAEPDNKKRNRLLNDIDDFRHHDPDWVADFVFAMTQDKTAW